MLQIMRTGGIKYTRYDSRDTNKDPIVILDAVVECTCTIGDGISASLARDPEAAIGNGDLHLAQTAP